MLDNEYIEAVGELAALDLWQRECRSRSALRQRCLGAGRSGGIARSFRGGDTGDTTLVARSRYSRGPSGVTRTWKHRQHEPLVGEIPPRDALHIGGCDRPVAGEILVEV